MSVFGVLRGLTFLARDVFEAALYLIPAPGLSGDDADGADVLAEREARVEVTEPWGECDCGLGDEPLLGDLEPVTVGDKLDSAIWLLEDIRNLLANHYAPVASASPPTPADATGQQETHGNDPQSVHQRHMRRLLGEDK